MKLRLTKVLSVLLCAALIIGTQHSFINAISNSPTAGVTAGDINGDASVNNKDLTRLFQYLSDWDVSVEEDALDVNGDGKINNKDLTRLFQYLSDWDVEIFVTSHCNHSGGTATCHTKAVCEICGRAYGNLNPDNHAGGTELRGKTAATCGEGGYTGDTYCLGCNKLISVGESTNPTYDHKHIERQGDKAATCWALGYTGDLVCTDCGMVLEYGTYISETDIHLHTRKVNDYAPTCTDYGFTGDIYCDDCHKYIEYGTNIEPTGHIHTEIRNNRAATCTESGYTGDTYCTDCGTLLSAGTVIEPFGHSGQEATYYRKGVCEICGEVYEDYKDFCCYDQLNENQKGIYNTIDAAVARLEMEWFELPFVEGTDAATMESDIRVALHAVAYDKPEYFWMPKNYVIQQFVDSFTGEHVKTEMSFSILSNDATRGYFNVTAAEKDAMQAELDEKIEEILALAQTYKTDFEKELFLHDYLCENISYDHASAENPNNADFRAYTIYGALINGTCVCEGYSRAMQLFCRKLGISCGLISGIGNGGPHMWNIIRIGDGLYYLDLTFDDSLENSGLEITYLHNYFNITTSQLQQDHELDDMYEGSQDYSDPNSDFNFFETNGDHTEYYYYTAVGAYIYANDATDAAQFALEKWQDGHTMVEYEYAGSINATTAKNLLANKLVGKLRVAGSAELPFGNYLILVFKK